MEKEQHVLIILPHPDDESFGAAGTICSHVEMGNPVTYACLTLGEMGRNLGNPPFATRESLPLIRKRELEHAANILGITNLKLFGLRDKTIEFEDEDKLRTIVINLIKETDPTLIITFYPGYSVHPDHNACGKIVTDVVRDIDEVKRPTVHCIAFSNGCELQLGDADIVNDVSNFAQTKLAAIKAHRSQTEQIAKELEENIKNSNPQFINSFYYEKFWTFKY